MSAIVFRKDPSDRLDYDIDYARWLTTGDVIESATAVMSDDCTATVDQVDVSETEVKVWVAGGATGEAGTLTVRATTAQARVKEYSVQFRIREA